MEKKTPILEVIEGSRLETEEKILLDLLDRKITFDEANQMIDSLKPAKLTLVKKETNSI